MAYSPTPHRAPLDGLRFLAFLAVFWFHARPDQCPWGGDGVRVFFALSGFLIARILDRDETGRPLADLGRFYLRRALRIFPLYYALLLYFGATTGVRHWPWMLAYLTNVEAYATGTFDTTLGHFWTLSVEEQFYLGFPPLFWITPRRLRPGLVGLLIAGSAGFQVYAHAHLRMPFAKWLTPYCMSDLAWGALAGLIELRTRPARGVASGLVAAGCALLVVAWRLAGESSPAPAGWRSDAAPTVFGVAGACLVFGLWRTTNPLIAGPLGFAPVAYLGRISYGLYAFHLPVLRGYFQPVEVPYAFYIPQIYRELIVTILLAAASWRWLEGPINRRKRHLDAPAPAHPAATAVGSGTT